MAKNNRYFRNLPLACSDFEFRPGAELLTLSMPLRPWLLLSLFLLICNQYLEHGRHFSQQR